MTGFLIFLLLSCAACILVTAVLNIELYNAIKRANRERQDLIDRCALIIDHYGDEL